MPYIVYVNFEAVKTWPDGDTWSRIYSWLLDHFGGEFDPENPLDPGAIDFRPRAHDMFGVGESYRIHIGPFAHLSRAEYITDTLAGEHFFEGGQVTVEMFWYYKP